MTTIIILQTDIENQMKKNPTKEFTVRSMGATVYNIPPEKLTTQQLSKISHKFIGLLSWKTVTVSRYIGHTRYYKLITKK